MCLTVPDLEPFPQPEPEPEPKYEAPFSALPEWIARPITVPTEQRASFAVLGLDDALVGRLAEKGYTEAFAVQAGLLPLLLPGRKHHNGDVCVSAATGSGKTLAYILPMVQGLRNRAVRKLRGVVVVPTRELVSQAKEVAELSSVGFGLKVGVSVGNQSFETEQRQIISVTQRYDPEAARQFEARAKQRMLDGWAEEDQELDDALKMLPMHVPQYDSQVDILICTPGRLVEHIRATKGFCLDNLEWLVIDEADRLLDQSFQEWVETVTSALSLGGNKKTGTARQQVLSKSLIPVPERTVTKVILSATMTRDLNKLNQLQLVRPVLMTVGHEAVPDRAMRMLAEEDAEMFVLPSELEEYAISVGNGAEKPLYLLELLQSRLLAGITAMCNGGDLEGLNEEDSTSSSDESHSNSDDDTSDDEEEGDIGAGLTPQTEGVTTSLPTPDHRSFTAVDKHPGKPTVLVFTSNNENASRLSHLLSILSPTQASRIGTLTKSSATSEGRKVLSAFRKGKLSVLVASDRASRGLDVPELAHIVNYDIPRSVTAYVHRVGRTARAGKAGQAWTFFTDTEAGWFWNKEGPARAPEIDRGNRKIQRTKLNTAALSEERRLEYREALNKLQKAVEGT